MSKSLTRLFLSLVMLVSPALALAQNAGSSVNNLPLSPPIVGTQLTYCPVGSSNDYKCTFAQVAAFVSANLAAGAAATNLGFVPAPVNSPTFTGTVTLPAGAAAANMSIIDPRAWGMSASNQSTTGTISGGGSVLTLAAARDFVNGQGIRINNAGAAFALNPATGCTATPGGTTGATTYQYKIAAIDAAGGVGAATALFQTTTGNAALSVLNYNAISCTPPTGTAAAGFAVFRNNGSNYVLVGFINSATPTFYDVGYGVSVVGAPDYVPSTAPAAALADWLVTKVVSGGGATTLTLNDPATTAAAGAGVYHDDTAALNAAVAQAQVSGGNAVALPPGQINVTGPVPITNAQFRLQGFGVNSIVYRANPTGDLFTFTGGKSLIADIFLQANAFQSGGYYLNLGTNGNNTLRNIRSYGGPGVVYIPGGAQNLISQIVFTNYTQGGIVWPSTAVGSDTVTDGTIFAEPQITLGYTESQGLSISGGITIMLANLNVGGQALPCFVKPAAGVFVHDLDVSHVACDSQGVIGNPALGNPGWTLDGTNAGATLSGLRFNEAWAGSMSGDGFYVNKVDSFSCVNCHAEANVKHGMELITVTRSTLTSPVAVGNSWLAANTYDGINIDANGSDISIVGGHAGFSTVLPSTTQRYGLNVAVGGYHVAACGMVNDGNSTSAYFFNGATTPPTCANY